MSLHYNANNNYFLVNGKEIFKLKADNENVNFLTTFCLRSMSNESIEVFLKGNADNFSVKYNFIDIFNITNIHKYLMTKNNIK